LWLTATVRATSAKVSPIGSEFPGGPGRTTTPEAFNSMMSGLEERVFGRLPDETWIYPGHGNDSTLGAERLHLAEWRARGW
jgi:glyoxylase-like metal-dependent hydrolase (beta-lactamase superfamily II)